MLDSHFLQSLLGAEMDRLGTLRRLEARLHSVAPLERPGVQMKIDVVMDEIAKLSMEIQVYEAAAATKLAKRSELVEVMFNPGLCTVGQPRSGSQPSAAHIRALFWHVLRTCQGWPTAHNQSVSRKCKTRSDG
jgi:hypothetical protein